MFFGGLGDYYIIFISLVKDTTDKIKESCFSLLRLLYVFRILNSLFFCEFLSIFFVEKELFRLSLT